MSHVLPAGSNRHSRLSLMAVIVFMALVCGGCGAYLLCDYDSLVRWYTGLNSCFYRNTTWTTDFFSPQTKHTGSIFCGMGMLLATGCIAICVRKLRQASEAPAEAGVQWGADRAYSAYYSRKDIPAILLLAGTATGLWLWSSALVQPSNDEVFSALNCAGLHPFQTLSYYMLPNNHVLFNLINNLLFHTAADKVATGRIISLGCYCALAIISYPFLLRLFGSRVVAVIAGAVLLLQFPVWGFASQARGYELLLLCGWTAFIATTMHAMTGGRRWLPLMALACAAGYFTIPVFLYFHVALVLFAAGVQLAGRSIDMRFWRYQLFAGALAFMLYLPVLCFSGLHSLSGNQYVAAANTQALLADLLPTSQNYLDYLFFNFLTSHHQADVVLFVLPLCLFLFRKNRLARWVGGFYVAMWVAAALVTLKIKVLPIDRSLPAQFSITLLAVLLTVYLAAAWLAARVRLPALGGVVLTLFAAALAANFIVNDRRHVDHYLCHFPANSWHELMLIGANKLPQGSSAAFSTECFYLRYLSAARGVRTAACFGDNEEFFVSANEPFPPGVAEHYQPFGKVGDFYIYQRKPGYK